MESEKKKYFVTAYDWDYKLQNQFGDNRSCHELSAEEVIAAIMVHGRAEIIKHEFYHEHRDGVLVATHENALEICFNNTYD